MMFCESWTVKIQKYQIKKEEKLTEYKNHYNSLCAQSDKPQFQQHSRSLLIFLNDTFKKQKQNKRIHQFNT